MDYDKEISELESQIAVIKEKQKKENESFRSGELYRSSSTGVLAKIYKLYSFDDKWGYIFNDGSGRIFDSKDEFVAHMNDYKFTYAGKAKDFSISFE